MQTGPQLPVQLRVQRFIPVTPQDALHGWSVAHLLHEKGIPRAERMESFGFQITNPRANSIRVIIIL